MTICLLLLAVARGMMFRVVSGGDLAASWTRGGQPRGATQVVDWLPQMTQEEAANQVAAGGAPQVLCLFLWMTIVLD